MKSSGLSARDFFQLTINSLLKVCTHCIDGHHIVSIEGRLLLTLDTGDKVELNILQQDVGSLSKSARADETNKFSSRALSDVDNNSEDRLSEGTENGLAVEDSVRLKRPNTIPVHEADTLPSATEIDLDGSIVDDDEQRVADTQSVPSAVLQPNGEFICSSCGEVMTCARYIKRHLSTHVCLLSLGTSVIPSLETAGDTSKDTVTQTQPKDQCTGYKSTDSCTPISLPSSETSLETAEDVGKDTVTRKRSKGQIGGYDSLPRQQNSAAKRFQKPECKVSSDVKWRSYPCRDCDSVFTSSAPLQLHRVQMHKPHECQKCGTVLQGRRNFSQHVRKEHPGQHICKAVKSFVCEYCSRTFHDESQLKDHISTVHLRSVEHRCDQCGKVLGSAITLQIHQRQLHERRFLQTCDGCGRQFTRLAGLINHLTRTHPHLLPDKYRRRLEQFACDQCDSMFLRLSLLRQHQEMRHGNVLKYICPVCSRRFSCRRYVFRHVRIHHPGAVGTVAAKISAVAVDFQNGSSSSAADVPQ